MIIDINKEIIINVKTTRLEAARRASENGKLIMQGIFVYIGFAELMETSSPNNPRLRHSLELEKWAENVCMLLMEIAAYKSAVQTIQNDYFEGHAILFKEFESALEMNIEILHDAIAGFNDYRKGPRRLAKPNICPLEQRKPGWEMPCLQNPSTSCQSILRP